MTEGCASLFQAELWRPTWTEWHNRRERRVLQSLIDGERARDPRSGAIACTLATHVVPVSMCLHLVREGQALVKKGRVCPIYPQFMTGRSQAAGTVEASCTATGILPFREKASAQGVVNIACRCRLANASYTL